MQGKVKKSFSIFCFKDNHVLTTDEEQSEIEPANGETEDATEAEEVTTNLEVTSEIIPANKSVAEMTTEVTTETETKPVTESDSNGDEVSLEVLREKLKFLESRMGLDAEVLVALNKTLTVPQTRQKIYQLFLNLVTKLEEKELGGATTTTTSTAAASTTTVPSSAAPMIGVFTFLQ